MLNTVERFDDGIKDCDKAIEINKNFVKVRNILQDYTTISFNREILNEFHCRHIIERLKP